MVWGDSSEDAVIGLFLGLFGFVLVSCFGSGGRPFAVGGGILLGVEPFDLSTSLRDVLADAVSVGWAAISLLPSFSGLLGLPSGLMWEVMKFSSGVFRHVRTCSATAEESWDVYCARQESIAVAIFKSLPIYTVICSYLNRNTPHHKLSSPPNHNYHTHTSEYSVT